MSTVRDYELATERLLDERYADRDEVCPVCDAETKDGRVTRGGVTYAGKVCEACGWDYAPGDLE